MSNFELADGLRNAIEELYNEQVAQLIAECSDDEIMPLDIDRRIKEKLRCEGINIKEESKTDG